MAPNLPRYRVVVKFRWWVSPFVETVAECMTAGEVLGKLAEWNRMRTVERVWWEARQADGSWRVNGRAAA